MLAAFYPAARRQTDGGSQLIPRESSVPKWHSTVKPRVTLFPHEMPFARGCTRALSIPHLIEFLLSRGCHHTRRTKIANYGRRYDRLRRAMRVQTANKTEIKLF